MDLRLTNKKYIITGSSKGIGLGIAETLLLEGAKVMITGRDNASVMNSFKSLDKIFPGNVFFFSGDLTDVSIVEALVAKAISVWGGIDGVIANAGSVHPVPEWDISEIEWNWYFSNNFDISAHIIKKSTPYLIQSEGNIVFIGSIAGIEEIGAPLPYSVSKAALAMYSKGLSRKLASYNIRVNTIAPGNILFPGGNWDKKSKADPEAVQRMLEAKVSLKKFGTPADIGNMVAFLLSDKAQFITGSCIVIDGGQTSFFH